MSDRQRRAITDDSPRPAKALRDETRLYIIFDPKAMAIQQKVLSVSFVMIGIILVVGAIVFAARAIPPKGAFDVITLIQCVIGVPLGLAALVFFRRLMLRQYDSLPLFFIDVEKGYAGDLDDCFAIQEIESIGVARVDGTAFGTKCISVTLREGKTYLFAAVDSDWFKVQEAAAQAEEIRRRFVAPATLLPKPTPTGFGVPRISDSAVEGGRVDIRSHAHVEVSFIKVGPCRISETGGVCVAGGIQRFLCQQVSGRGGDRRCGRVWREWCC